MKYACLKVENATCDDVMRQCISCMKNPDYLVEAPETGPLLVCLSDWLGDKNKEKAILQMVVKIAAPSLEPCQFEALAEALNQLAKTRKIDFVA